MLLEGGRSLEDRRQIRRDSTSLRQVFFTRGGAKTRMAPSAAPQAPG